LRFENRQLIVSFRFPNSADVVDEVTATHPAPRAATRDQIEAFGRANDVFLFKIFSHFFLIFFFSSVQDKGHPGLELRALQDTTPSTATRALEVVQSLPHHLVFPAMAIVVSGCLRSDAIHGHTHAASLLRQAVPQLQLALKEASIATQPSSSSFPLQANAGSTSSSFDANQIDTRKNIPLSDRQRPFHLAIAACARGRDANLVKGLLNTMASGGVDATSATFITVAHTLASMGHVARAIEVLGAIDTDCVSIGHDHDSVMARNSKKLRLR
jgi:hypothetical protein